MKKLIDNFFIGSNGPSMVAVATWILVECGIGLRWLLQGIFIYVVITTQPPADLQHVQTSLIVLFSVMFIADVLVVIAQINYGLNKFTHYIGSAVDLGWIITSSVVLYIGLMRVGRVNFENATAFWVVMSMVIWTLGASILNLCYHMPMCFEKIRTRVVNLQATA
ncbi:MAG: hypothetical protein AAB556_00210 [Patescibacteria group bacterium]